VRASDEDAEDPGARHWARSAVAHGLFGELYPFSQHFHDHGGLFQHYLDEGPRAAPPCLLLHGNPTWSFAWRRLVPALAKKQRVVAPDHIGCGLSDKPRNYPYRLVQHVENLERLVLALDLKCITLILHDWGGAIGMGFARRHPERVARLVFMNTAAFVSGDIPRRIALCKKPLLGELLVRRMNAFALGAMRMAVTKPLPEDVRRGYLFPYGSYASRIALLRFVQDIPLDDSHPSYAELEAIDAALDAFRDRPTCLVWGERDWCFTPTFRQLFEARFPAAESHPLAGAAHLLFEDEPEGVRAAIEGFLAAYPLP
jgi:haloalkane dehalogenase